MKGPYFNEILITDVYEQNNKLHHWKITYILIILSKILN